MNLISCTIEFGLGVDEFLVLVCLGVVWKGNYIWAGNMYMGRATKVVVILICVLFMCLSY